MMKERQSVAEKQILSIFKDVFGFFRLIVKAIFRDICE